MKLPLDSVYGHLSIQGMPVTGLRRFGVPPGGAFQPDLLASLNTHVGNAPDACGLELGLGSFSFNVSPEHDLVFAFGPHARVLAGRTRLLNGYANRLIPGQPVQVSLEAGARAYLAFRGGVIGTPGSLLSSGTELELGEQASQPLSGLLHFPEISGELLALPGDPQFDWIFAQDFVVSPASDRVGVRLDGGQHRHNLELPSRPATMGSVQVTPSGQLIVFGPDGPTIGGYPQAATLLKASFDTLAQLRPGDAVRFKRARPYEYGPLS